MEVNKVKALKYDQEYKLVRDMVLDGNTNNSVSLLLQKVCAGAKVLEFGAASGYMTRYLKEELGCTVFISEIDEQAARIAGQYADEVYVGDVERLEWLEKWSAERFDIILFADVLEHLKEPLRVLREAPKLLKKDGQVLASIPNIAYNGVLIELWKNKFSYRSLGLLDDTHLRFFSESSVRDLFNSSELAIQSLEYTTVNPENSEFRNSLKDLPWSVRRAFKKRPLSNVYQFVVTASERV